VYIIACKRNIRIKHVNIFQLHVQLGQYRPIMKENDTVLETHKKFNTNLLHNAFIC